MNNVAVLTEDGAFYARGLAWGGGAGRSWNWLMHKQLCTKVAHVSANGYTTTTSEEEEAIKYLVSLNCEKTTP